MGASNKSLNVFSLAMISVAAVLSVRNFPSMAVYGWSSIGWYMLGTLLFLLPLTLASAELATGWSTGGGVYRWVKEAFGERAGFIAIFCEWSNNLVWFPSVLSFIAGTLAYAINPDLANNGMYMFGAMMVAFWGATLVAWLGPHATARFNNIGVVIGSLVPTVLLVGFALAFLVQGNPLKMGALSWGAVVPNVSVGTIPFVASIVLMFAGMEMAGFHALAVRDPGRSFPRAMALAAFVIFIVSVLGTLALAFVVPTAQLNLASGVMQAFKIFLQGFGYESMVPFIAIMFTLGGLALLISWLVGPVMGLGVTSAAGDMPPVTRRLNKEGVPTGMLLIQGAIATLFSLCYVYAPSVNAAYWILSAMTVLLLCITYMLVFSAVIRLRYTQPDTHRAYRIPGGTPGVWIVGGVGFFSSAFAFVVGCLPTGNAGMSTPTYVALMLGGTALLSIIPVAIILQLRKPSWVASKEELVALGVQ